MKVINLDVLEECDVVLTTSTGLVSKVVRFGIKSDISHAMVCVARGSLIDSTSDGVQARNPQKMFYTDSSEGYILRYKYNLTETQKNQIIDYVRSMIGRPYSTYEAVKCLTKPSRQGSGLQFCSRLVAQAYAEAGILISDNPDFCTPDDIKNSDLFVQVEPAFTGISEEEIATIESNGTTVTGMQIVTNNLLKAINSCSDNKILDVTGITEALKKDYSLDSCFADAFKSSGYLEHWREDIIKYEWRYDFELMKRAYLDGLYNLDDLLRYCVNTISDDNRGCFNHWYKNYKGYSKLCDLTNLKTFKLLRELYSNIVGHQKIRVRVAKKFLNEFGE